MKNLMFCNGENCPLQRTCLRNFNWLSSDDDNDEDSMILPEYHDGNCRNYKQKEFYGG